MKNNDLHINFDNRNLVDKLNLYDKDPQHVIDSIKCWLARICRTIDYDFGNKMGCRPMSSHTREDILCLIRTAYNTSDEIYNTAIKNRDSEIFQLKKDLHGLKIKIDAAERKASSYDGLLKRCTEAENDLKSTTKLYDIQKEKSRSLRFELEDIKDVLKKKKKEKSTRVSDLSEEVRNLKKENSDLKADLRSAGADYDKHEQQISELLVMRDLDSNQIIAEAEERKTRSEEIILAAHKRTTEALREKVRLLEKRKTISNPIENLFWSIKDKLVCRIKDNNRGVDSLIYETIPMSCENAGKCRKYFFKRVAALRREIFSRNVNDQ